MTYFALYFTFILSIWFIYRVGWSQGLRTIISILVPTVLIIFFNLKAGRLIFRSPIVGIISVLPTAIFIYHASKPIVALINSWFERKENDFSDFQDVVEAEVISKDEF